MYFRLRQSDSMIESLLERLMKIERLDKLGPNERTRVSFEGKNWKGDEEMKQAINVLIVLCGVVTYAMNVLHVRT